MSNAFDIEKAKAGEPVERIYGARWQQVEFVAKWNESEAICRIPGHDFPQLIPLKCLRMAPKKIKVRYRVALFSDNDETWPGVTTSEAIAESWPSKKTFNCWITHWIETEVEKNNKEKS